MNKKFIIKKNEEIKKIIEISNKTVGKSFIIYYCKNKLSYNRYCISISKKIGKANVRNYYKRITKDILMKNNFNFSNDYVIILRKFVLKRSYLELEKELIDLLRGDK